ncbi:MAG: STAS domain-containing protein [Nitrospira sp.]|nr:MAG: STAS domain-containing protein [Nitrospira sp.]
MELQEEVREGVCRLSIVGEMTIYSALELKSRLLGALAGSGVLELQVEDVTEVDTAGLQLLFLVKREAVAAGKQVQLLAPSPALQEALQHYCVNLSLESI